MANSPQISKNVIYPYVVSVLNAKASNVSVICADFTSDSLLEWRPGPTGEKIAIHHSKIFLNAIHYRVKLGISFPNKNVECVIPTFTDVVGTMITIQRVKKLVPQGGWERGW